MKMISPDAPAVWVLIFDRKPTDCEFDRLDLEATCFEQFLLQDVRSNAGPLEIFGGASAFSELANVMTSTNRDACLTTISTDDTNASVIMLDDHQEMESSLRSCQMPLLGLSNPDLGNSRKTENSFPESSRVDTAFSANLVWIEARTSTSTQPARAASFILDFVYDRLTSCFGIEQRCPVLLVTFRSGNDFIVSEPLKCGLSEESMHVPLWIRPNAGHACRVQGLAGSFDLLPTITTFLGSTHATTDEVSPPDVPHISEISVREVSSTLLSSEPRSLAFLCGAPQVCSDRVLQLRGDNWTAARTEGFMLVISDDTKTISSQTESDGDSSEEPSRRLYVKPDDRFNVNDVSRTYATVVEELSGVQQNPDRPAC